MSNTFSRIAIPAAIGATMALSFGAALAQSQQSGNPPTQAQPGQSSGAAADQQTGTTSTPQGMEHGRMMRDQGQKMMQNDKSMEHGQMGNPPCGPGQVQTQTTQNSGCK